MRTSAILLVIGLLASAAVCNEVPIVVLKGEPAEMGREHARKLGQSIKLLHEKYLGRWFADEQVKKQALVAAFVFRNQLLPEHKAELAALAQELKMDVGEAMLGNCFLDLIPMTTCSTIALPAEASPDGVARFGRNLDFPGMDVADKHSVLLVYKPKDRYAFAAVSWPGLIGVLSGMNEHGLTVCNMEVDRPMRLPSAMPYIMLYRTVLERCRTVDEAIDLVKRTARQTANNLMVMDAQGNRAVLEITPDAVTVRRGRAKSALISTNHHRGEEQDKRGRCARYDRLHDESARNFGREDPAAVQRMLGDVAQGKMTLQSMVFEPKNRVVYLAVGAEATKRPYQRIDLKEYFVR